MGKPKLKLGIAKDMASLEKELDPQKGRSRIYNTKWKSLLRRGFKRPKTKAENDKRLKEARHG